MEDQNSKRLESLAQELEKRRQQHQEVGGRRRLFRRWLRRLLMLSAFCFFLLALVFFINFFRLNSDLIEGHIKQGIIPNLTQGRFTLVIGKFSGNLLKGVDLENILVQNPHFETGATLLTVPKVSLKYSLLDILFGRLVLQKLIIDSPILTVRRNDTGRGNWDFSDDSVAQAASSAVSVNGKVGNSADENVWQKRDKAQVLADQYLEDIQIHNLSVLVPAPHRLIKDEFAARLIRLPSATWQVGGVDISLRKHPAKTFNTHLLKISRPGKADWLKFQVTTMKENGNFTASFDALNQSFNLAVENLGQAGRRINFFDGRQRDRLNLEWVWARSPENLPEKIRGLTGIVHIAELSDLASGILSDGNSLSGSVLAKFACAADKPLYDAGISLEIGSMSVSLPYVPPVRSLSATLAAAGRRAEMQRLTIELASYSTSINGFMDFADESRIYSVLNSEIGGEQLAVAASYTRVSPGLHQFDGRIERKAGRAEITFRRQLSGKQIRYSDFCFTAGLQASGSAVDILPLKLLPDELKRKIDTYLGRVDLLGPLTVSSRFASFENWRTSAVTIDFAGARIVSRGNPQDFMSLDGSATLDNGRIKLNDLAAGLEALRFIASGSATIIAGSPFVSDFKLQTAITIPGSESFAMTAERIQSSIGLRARPDFDRIELAGKDIAILNADSASGITLNAGFDRLQLVRRGRAIWADGCRVEASAGWQKDDFKSGPGPVKAAVGVELYGIPVKAEIDADLASKTFKNVSLSGGGSNFGRLLEAVKTQPEGREMLTRHPLELAGSFNFMFLGSGPFINPELDGWIKFPALQIGMGSMHARLPFHLQLKTADKGYNAVVKAGDAAVKIKDVTFDLGRSEASLAVSELNASSGVKLAVNANSSIFGADFKASGVIRPAKSRFDNLRLQVTGSSIEELAREITRIGRFALPFSLSGKFTALADLNGSFASPSGKGQVDIGSLNIDFPLKTAKAAAVLSARQFSGRLRFEKRGDRLFSLDLDEVKGLLLDAAVKIQGKARLENQGKGFKPVLDGLSAELSGLELKKLYGFLAEGLLPAEVGRNFQLDSGTVGGSFIINGNPDKIVATGSANLQDGSIRLASFKESVQNLRANLNFEGRSDSGYARIGVSDCAASFGRSNFSVSSGWVEDPLKAGKISLSGRFGRIYPADILSMLGGMKVPAVSFPEEGWLDGSLEVAGTFARPLVKAEVQSTAMQVQYNAGQHVFTVPIGNNQVRFSLNPGTGEVEIEKCELGLLNGRLVLKNAGGRFLPGQPFRFALEGNMDALDFSSIQIDKSEALRGFLGGGFKADWKDNGERDAVFNLEFKDIFVPSLPMLDPATMAKAGAEFIEKPDFRVGQLNFYVTTEEDEDLQGRLLIADGLFAGPHLRFEIGNSEFDPLAMKLDAKLMINPQSLRQTEIGRKLKKWTVTLQDEKTGVPYVDLAVGGTWDKPELLAKTLEKKAVRRVKRNFIGRIFGGHRPHKASVEELTQWFPGWKKGM